MDAKGSTLKNKFIIDEEIDLFEGLGESEDQLKDLLNSSTYVNTLTNCVMNAPDDRPFTIGLFGEWGSGKSSIIKTFSRDVVEKYAASQKKVRVITYDAWKYSNDSFRRMFLLRMQEGLGFQRQELMNSFYLNSSEDAHVDTKINWKEVVVGSVIVFFLVFAIIKYGDSSDFKIAANALVAFASLLYAIFRGAFREVKVNIQRPHLFAPEQFEACFNEMCDKALAKGNAIKNTYQYIKGESGETGIFRLIIIIDNIDRCSPELAYELLTNIKNFLGQKHNTLFIVPVDEDALKKHIVNRNTAGGHEADEFLRKFFNLCIRIKPFHQEEMFDFADQLNAKYDVGLNSNTIGLISQEFASNPRRIIQIINNLMAEFQNIPQQFVENDESLICKLLILREEYPDFYKAVVKDVTLLFNKERQTEFTNKSASLKQFLYRTTAITNPYFNHMEVVESILSNSVIFDKIPKPVLDELSSDSVEETNAFISNTYHKDKLLNYILQKIQLNIKRNSYKSGVNLYLNYLMRISDNCELNKRDYARISDIVKDVDLSAFLQGETSMRPIEVFAQKMAKESQPALNNSLSVLLRDEQNYQKLSEEMVLDGVFFGYSIWSGSILSVLQSRLLNCFEKKPEDIFNYEYGDNKPVVFSDAIVDKIIEAQFRDDQLVDDSANLFIRLIRTYTIQEKKLADAVSKLSEKTGTYKSDNTLIQQVESHTDYCTRVLSEFPEDYVLSITDSISEFVEKVCNSYLTTNNYGRVKHAYFRDIHDQEKQRKFVDFFFQVTRITRKPVFTDSYLSIMFSVTDTSQYLLQKLNDLLAYSFSISHYAHAILDVSIFSPELLNLYKVLFVEKSGPNYYVDEGVVEQKLKLVLAFYYDGNSSLEEDIEKLLLSLFNDERCAKLLIRIITAESKDNIQKLPASIHKRLIPVFDEHFDEYSDNMSIMHVMVSTTNAQLKAKVVRRIVNMLTTSGREKDAFCLIKELNTRDKKQTAMLISTLEAMPDNDALKKDRDECIALLQQ